MDIQPIGANDRNLGGVGLFSAVGRRRRLPGRNLGRRIPRPHGVSDGAVGNNYRACHRQHPHGPGRHDRLRARHPVDGIRQARLRPPRCGYRGGAQYHPARRMGGHHADHRRPGGGDAGRPGRRSSGRQPLLDRHHRHGDALLGALYTGRPFWKVIQNTSVVALLLIVILMTWISVPGTGREHHPNHRPAISPS